MRALTRLPEPRVLAENKVAWTEDFRARYAKGQRRPAHGRYAHDEVVESLQAMSSHKCFYCERSTKEIGHEVDHRVEVSRDQGLAFEWTNLYLVCKGCNAKLDEDTIPCAECLDPCAPGVRPADHLTFEDELIKSRAGSTLGAQTIRKHKLDRERLDLARLRAFKQFFKTADDIAQRRIAEGGRAMTAREKEILESFALPDRPFSLMFAVHVGKATDGP